MKGRDRFLGPCPLHLHHKGQGKSLKIGGLCTMQSLLCHASPPFFAGQWQLSCRSQLQGSNDFPPSSLITTRRRDPTWLSSPIVGVS
jgi:hypothetical protein